MVAILLKTLVILVCVLGTAWPYIGPAARAIRFSPLTLEGVSILIIFRLVAFVGIYLVGPGSVSSSDLVGYYFPQAEQTYHGAIPYRDFHSSYGPGFPYLASAFMPLSKSHGAVAAIVVAFELASIATFIALFRRRDWRSDPVASRAVALYALNPASFYWVGVAGYNGPIIAFFWVTGLLLFQRGRKILGFVLAALSIVFCKFLGALALPAWIIHPRLFLHSFRAATPLAVGVASFYAMGIDVLMPLRLESDSVTMGNLWFLASAVIPLEDLPGIWKFGPPALFLTTTAILFGVVSRKSAGRLSVDQMIGLISAINCAFMLLSKKTYPSYATMFLVLACYVVARTNSAARFGEAALLVSSSLGLFTPALWNELGQPKVMRLVLMPTDGLFAPTVWLAALLLLIDAMICLAWLVLFCLSVKVALSQTRRRTELPADQLLTDIRPV